jgi:hypothetical protein
MRGERPHTRTTETDDAALSPWVEVMAAQTATSLQLAEAVEALEARAEASSRALAALAENTDAMASLLSRHVLHDDPR